MTLWMSAVYMTAFSVGMHGAVLGAHLALMTLGASLNHAGFDLEIRFLGEILSAVAFDVVYIYIYMISRRNTHLCVCVWHC